MTWPALPARVDMPTIATDRGRRNLATAFGPRAASGPVISHPCRAATSADASPLSSGCQYGFTFMPTFSSSALQLTMLAMKLTPTSSVTLAMA